MNLRNAEDWTPLHLAAEVGNIEIIIALLGAGAQIEDTVNNKSWKEIAEDCGHTDVIKFYDDANYLFKALIEINNDQAEGIITSLPSLNI